MNKGSCISMLLKKVKQLKPNLWGISILWSLLLIASNPLNAQSLDSIREQVRFNSEGVTLAGTLYTPENAQAAVVLVHGSGQESRMTKFAELLAENGLSVFTYDKRGVGESGGVYAGPEVGTNNIDSTNLSLLAKDANAAVHRLHEQNPKLAIGLVGFSQAGWIIPMAANENPLVAFLVLFSCPTLTTLEQLRFQFYTDGDTYFWEKYTLEEVREHIQNAPDRYQFKATDPKLSLRALSIPGLWLFGKKDIQIPVELCMEQLNALKAQGKAFDYSLFSKLGHNTAFTEDTTPVDISIHWIKQQVINIKK